MRSLLQCPSFYFNTFLPSLICFRPLLRRLERLDFFRLIDGFWSLSEGPQEEIDKGCVLYFLKTWAQYAKQSTTAIGREPNTFTKIEHDITLTLAWLTLLRYLQLTV